MNTTAGSFSLLGSVVPEDAGVVKRLRAAGAVILGKPIFLQNSVSNDNNAGKANLCEFSQFRGKLALGWSGRGGQCTNAYYINADPSGSSAGSGVAASIGLATVTLGTETDGSITDPASNNNVVGIKPTVGLTSRAGGMKYLANVLTMSLTCLVSYTYISASGHCRSYDEVRDRCSNRPFHYLRDRPE